MFKQNESGLDKNIRLVIGFITLLFAIFFLNGVIQTITFVISIILIFTGLIGFCLLYKIFGFKTKK